MKRSTTRILTTHTGSLPRPAALLDLMLAEQAGRLADRQALAEETRRAVAEVVRQQSAAGLDVINDGELNRVDYTVYVKDRLQVDRKIVWMKLRSLVEGAELATRELWP